MTPGEENLFRLEQQQDEINTELEKLNRKMLDIRSALEMREIERKNVTLHLALADIRMSIALQKFTISEAAKQTSKEYVKSLGKKYKSKGMRPVTLTFAGGSKLVLYIAGLVRAFLTRRRGSTPSSIF